MFSGWCVYFIKEGQKTNSQVVCVSAHKFIGQHRICGVQQYLSFRVSCGDRSGSEYFLLRELMKENMNKLRDRSSARMDQRRK